MTDNDKVQIGNGHWIKVTRSASWTHLAIGENDETGRGKNMDEWETFQVIKKLAEASGLYLDKTGAGGIIVRRPENPKEAERRDELAAQFSPNGAITFHDLVASTRAAIDHIVAGEVERGEL